MSRSLKVILTTLIFYGIHYLFDDLYFRRMRESINGVINQLGLSHLITYFIVGVPIFIATLFINNRKDFFISLGLSQGFSKALIFSIICTLPMFLGFAFLFDLNTDIKLNTILISIVAAGFFEELYFRGFLFGQLFRYSNLGFISSVLLGALLFGMVHLYQSNDLGELFGIFLVTFLGAILFAWVYVEWNYNLWVPIMLHALMNLSWELFNVSDNALGGTYSNVFRVITIALIIILTVLYKKRIGDEVSINKSSIF